MSEIAANTQLFPPWKELLKIISVGDYGTEYTHDELAKILGIRYPSTNYYPSIKKVDEELLMIGKHLENIPNKGYRLILPEEFVHSSNDQLKRAIRRDRFGLIITQSAPRDKMDDHTRKKHEEHSLGYSRRISMMETTAKPLLEIEQQLVKRQLNTTKPKVLQEEN